MKQSNDKDHKPADIQAVLKYLKILAVLCVVLLIMLPILLHFNLGAIKTKEVEKASDKNVLTAVPNGFEIPPFEDTEEGKLAEYGYKLITETHDLIGPKTEKAITGNGLNCSSCHLDGGTKPFAAPYMGLSGVFPIYIGREDKIESLEERINGCFERSMNGKSIDVNSKEMRAIISYMKLLSKNSMVGTRLKGQGFVDFRAPHRAADIKKGGMIYKNTCSSCHGPNGRGLKGTKNNREGGYIYPPLWGEDSYNDGAGMARLLTAARFIKGNMPLGVKYDAPLLSDDDAFDVAAFINSQERPTKANKELDYPNLGKKPADCPYPPYNDEISQEQHKFGPFTFKN